MTRYRFGTLLGGASALALALGLSASPAAAFDESNWSWTNTVSEIVNINTNIGPDTYAPVGLTQVEQLQVNIGDLTATTAQDGMTITLPLDSTLDAADQLPTVQGAATAVANLASVDSNVSTYFHDGQVAFGNFAVVSDPFDPSVNLNAGNVSTVAQTIGGILPTGNRMTDTMSATAIAGLLGAITQGTITATATADNVLNANVKLDAVAIGNLHSVSVNADEPNSDRTDSIVVGDLTQFNFNNVSAVASAANLYVGGVANMGQLATPMNNLTATAVGNVSSVVNKFSPH